MASGDIFSETEGVAAAGALVSIRPAAGVQVVLTNTFAYTTNIQFCGGGTSLTYFGDAGGGSYHWSQLGSGNIKLLLTNDEYVNILNPDAVAQRYGYTGMEI